MKLLTAAFLLVSTSASAADYAAFLTGQFAASQGRVDLAATDLLTALDADPGNLSLEKDAFALSLLAGRSEAETLAPRLPDNAIAQLLLADSNARSGDWVRAELAYAELPKDPVLDALKPLLLAWAQQAQGLTDRALGTLQDGMKDSHLAAFYLLHAALIADVAHRDGLADRLYGSLQKELTEPNVRLAQIIASWQARSGHMQAAKDIITELGKQSPDLALAIPGLLATIEQPQIAGPRQGIAEAYAGLAGSLRQDSQAALPPMLLSLALRMDPDLTEAHLVDADIAAAAGHFRDAAADLRAVKADDPLAAVVQLHLAAYESRLGQAAQAEGRLEQLVKQFPDQSEPYARLGDVYAGEKQYADAVGAYSGAVARLPHPEAKDWSLFYARGACYERVHDWPRAEDDMRQALKLSPNEPVVLNFLGFSWAEQNRNLTEARDMIQRALTQRPNDGAIVDSLGWVVLRLGDVPRAVQLLQQAAELEPVDPTITGHLGDAYWDAGRHVEAEDQWRRALVLKPDSDEAARIEARLKSASAAP